MRVEVIKSKCYEVQQGMIIDLPMGASDRIINNILGIEGVTWENLGDHALYGTDKRTGTPVIALMRKGNV